MVRREVTTFERVFEVDIILVQGFVPRNEGGALSMSSYISYTSIFTLQVAMLVCYNFKEIQIYHIAVSSCGRSFIASASSLDNRCLPLLLFFCLTLAFLFTEPRLTLLISRDQAPNAQRSPHFDFLASLQACLPVLLLTSQRSYVPI